jgi:hypothetical protein
MQLCFCLASNCTGFISRPDVKDPVLGARYLLQWQSHIPVALMSMYNAMHSDIELSDGIFSYDKRPTRDGDRKLLEEACFDESDIERFGGWEPAGPANRKRQRLSNVDFEEDSDRVSNPEVAAFKGVPNFDLQGGKFVLD